MDDFNEGNNFDDDYHYRDDDDSSILDDVADVKDRAKDLKGEYKKYKSRNTNSESALKDNGKAFRENMRAANNSRSAINPTTEGVVGRSAINPMAEGVVGNTATTGVSNAGIGTATGGTAVGGTAVGGTAVGGTAVGGTAVGGTAVGGTAVGGTAVGGTAAGGAAAGGAAAGGAAAAGASATGIGLIVVAAIQLLKALKKLEDKVNKKIEEHTGIDTKKMKKYLLLGVIGFIFLIIILCSALFTVSDTAYDDLDQLIKRREKRYGKSLIMFTDSEYDELINKDYDDDSSYETILKSYGSDLFDSFLIGLDTESIYDDETLSQKEKEEKLLSLGSGEVKKYLKAQRENFNKIIWNASSGYNGYKFQKNQKYDSIDKYSKDNSGRPQLTSNAATISGNARYSDPNTFYWDIYKNYNSGLSMYEIKDSNGKNTGLKIPEIVLEGESNKDEAGKYYVDLLGDYLQKWVIPYTMMIDSQDKDFIDRVINEMYHRVDVNVYKLSQETKNTTKTYYMKAIQKLYENEYIIYDDAPGSKMVDPSTISIKEYRDLNTKEYQLGKNTDTDYIDRVDENGRLGSRYKETTIYTELDPAMLPATNPDGSPMVKEINVTREISSYKNVPKVVNIESFYDIVRENYKINPISESNPAVFTSNPTKDVDSKNGILKESYYEIWREELEKVGQTEKKGYSVSYYTEEQMENLGRKISRVEWAQDYGDLLVSSTGTSSSTSAPGETGGETGKITVHGKTYKLYNQVNFSGNIPASGSGLTSTCMILSAYKSDLNLNPDGLASKINWTGPHSLSQTADDLKKYGVDVELYEWRDYGGMPDKKNEAYKNIKANLQAGKPVLILVDAPCPYTSEEHYMVLIDIDKDLNVMIADPNGGNLKKDTLTNMVSYIFDNAHSENGYILIKDDVKSTSGSSTSSSGSTSISKENSEKLTEMLKYAVSLEGKVAYVWGGGPHKTKNDLVSSGADCSGFVISLYRIFFSKNFNPTRTEIYKDCELVNVDGLVGKKIFDGGSGTVWNSDIESKIKPGDIVATAGHVTIYAGDIKGDGKLYTISQGGGMGPSVLEASSYYTTYPIKGICRFVGDATISSGATTSSSAIDNSRIYPTKTKKELEYAKKKYEKGKSYSYDDLYFAYYHIGQYYTELDELNGHSTDSLNNGPGLAWPIDVKKYPGCEIINCFYGYTPAYGEDHNGVDISSGGHVTGFSLHVGPEIVAAHDGFVKIATSNPVSDADGYTYVQIESEDGSIETQYGHLSKILVKQGDKVKKGDVIGKMGNTGHSTGTHLHFAMFANGTRVDPLNYYIISKVGSNEEVDYSKLDKNAITSLPTGYKFLRSKGGGGSQALVDFIYGWEGSSPMNSDGTKYIISPGPEGNRTVGHGIDLDAGGYDAVLKKAGYSTSIGSYIDKDFVDALTVKEISATYREPVVSRVAGLNLKEYQIDALTSRAFNCGVEGAVGTRNGMTFVEAYKKYWKDSDTSNKANYNHALYLNYMNKPVTSEGVYMAGLEVRRKSEWKLFQTGVYDSSH